MPRTCFAAVILSLSLNTGAQAALSISSKPTENMSCSGNVCTATAQKAVLNVNDLTNMLAAGDTTVKTGGGAIDIQILTPFSWTSTSRLTLTADHSLRIDKPVTVAGRGAVTITVNKMQTTGDLHFEKKGRLDFWNVKSRLKINGASYTLEKDIDTLAADIADNPSKFYALSADYDAAEQGTYSSSPISTAFEGTLNGLGHTISHLSIEDTEETCTGLFANILQDSELRDIRLQSASIIGDGRVGVLVGCSDGSVTGTTAEGSVNAGPGADQLSGDVGGLIGYADLNSVVSGAQASVDVLADDYNFVGGLIGRSLGLVTNSHASGNVTSGDKTLAGGLVGDGSTISNCYARGSVTSKQISGGLAGEASLVSGSYALGAVSGDFWVGGLVGGNAKIENGYSVGHVSCTGKCYGGGLQGYQNENAIGRRGLASSYSLGGVSAPGGSATGGSVGRVEGHIDIQNVYWDVNTSGEDRACGKGNCSKIVGYTDGQLKSGLPDGFDPKLWGQSPNINNGYPYLLANPPPQ